LPACWFPALRLLFVESAGLEPARFGNQGFEFAKEFFFHPGFGWHNTTLTRG
jgi:hypothetical protein